MLRFHALSAPVVAELHSADEHPGAVAALLDAAYSSRLLLLVVAMRESAAARWPEGVRREPALAVGDAEELLSRAQARDAAAFRRVLLDPQAGLWGAQLLRRLRRLGAAVPGDPTPLWVDAGYLHQLAAAAAIASGLEFTLPVPVRRGRVVLPGLGRATFRPAGDPGDHALAEVRAAADRVVVVCGTEEVTLPMDPETDAQGWEGIRRLRAGSGEEPLTVVVDDLGPYGLTDGAGSPDRLDDGAFARWRAMLDDAWALLLADHPERAAALQAGLLSLAPLPQGMRLRPHSASTSDAFGLIVLSEPDHDEGAAAVAVQLAVTLVHEFRHTLLNGLLLLEPLFLDCADLFHAPWRDDPRPIGGAVHGAYSFAGVTAFWRERLRKDRGAAAELAGFEFALWRQQALRVAVGLDGHAAITPRGLALLDSLERELGSWAAEPVAESPRELAGMAARHHATGWRTHHYRQPAAEVQRFADAWRAGAAAPDCRPEAGLLAVDPDACRLDVLAVLARLSIIAPKDFWRLADEPESIEEVVPGATVADLVLTRRDHKSALDLYERELAAAGARPIAWAGFGVALERLGRERSAALLEAAPELVAAVFRALADAGEPPLPTALVGWMAGEEAQASTPGSA